MPTLINDPAAAILRELRGLNARLTEIEATLSTSRKDLLTVAELASLVGRSEYTCRRWIHEGRIEAIRLAEGGPRGRLLVRRDAVDRLIAAGLGGEIPAAATRPASAPRGGAMA